MNQQYLQHYFYTLFCTNMLIKINDNIPQKHPFQLKCLIHFLFYSREFSASELLPSRSQSPAASQWWQCGNERCKATWQPHAFTEASHVITTQQLPHNEHTSTVHSSVNRYIYIYTYTHTHICALFTGAHTSSAQCNCVVMQQKTPYVQCPAPLYACIGM